MKFIILCHPRTGSTLLIRALGDHPDIRQGMEIFNPILEGNARYVDWRKEAFTELYGKQDSYTDKIGYLDADRFDLSLLAERFFRDFNGTKIMYDQISTRSKAWLYIQSLEDLRVIILERNLVESAVSFRIAMQTDIWHIENGSSNPPCPRMEYPLEFFGWFYDHFCAGAGEFAATFDESRIIRVNYRDLVTSWPATMQLIQSHLGIEPLEIPKAYEKRRRERIEDLVVNYHNVRRHYSRHPVLARHFKTADWMIGNNSP
jgi:LPS sulfotransferase NodH